jgi:putative DNA primase/helicase
MKNLITRFTQIVASWIANFFDILASMDDSSSYRPAGCHNILALLHYLCEMDMARRDWVLRWLAYQLRNPGAKMSTAIIVTGSRFSKSIFFEDVLAGLFGERACTILDDELQGHAMRWARSPINLVTVHGVFSPRNVSRLRALVASTSLIVERAGKAPETHSNQFNFVFLTSSFDFLPVQAELGRRLVILETPPQWPRHYYAAVMHEINNGGIDALREHLLQLDLSGFTARTQPPAAQIHVHQEAA